MCIFRVVFLPIVCYNIKKDKYLRRNRYCGKGEDMYYNSMNEAIFHRTLAHNDFFDLMLAGITHPNPSYRILHNVSKSGLWDNYVFEYVVSGEGHIETETKSFDVHAGDTYFLNKLQKHIYYSDKKHPYTKCFVVLHGTLMDSLVASFGLTDSVIVRHVDTQRTFDKLFTLADVDGELPLDDIMQCALSLVQQIKPHDYHRVDAPLKFPELIKGYLDENISQKVTLEDISNALNISKSHIERLFADKYGVSPLKYFAYNKINFACTLIINKDYTLNEIADMLSFADAKYLSKCVKAHTGMSPSQLRKKQK